MERFRRWAESETGIAMPDTRALHQWSVSAVGDFWSLVWDDVSVIGEQGPVAIAPSDDAWRVTFFPEGRLSFAENILDGRGAPEADPAIVYQREDGFTSSRTWRELRQEVAEFATALTSYGVGPGDCVAAWMPNVPETIVAALAASAVGAVFTSASPDFGPTALIDRFGQVAPRILLATDGYHYGGKVFPRLDTLAEIADRLPSVELVVVLGILAASPNLEVVARSTTYEEFLSKHRGSRPLYQRFAFDHPLFVLYSSGTTGPPKCLVHSAGGVLLKHLQEHQHHCDIRRGDRVFYHTTCGWMMWNWLVSSLATGATVVLFDGNPLHPGPSALLDLVDNIGVTLFGVSAKYIGALSKVPDFELTQSLDSLRTVTSTGSPLSADSFRFVYDEVKEDVHLASISGGTDICGCFVMGDPTQPVFAGEIQGPALGMAVSVYDAHGRPVVHDAGELVCTQPFPSMPVRFWGDTEGTQYRSAYFDRFPGVWTHGDFIHTTVHNGYVILGRSDATLNAGGVRIGTAEIYRVVESFREVADALAVEQASGTDTHVLLFLRLATNYEMTAELESAIRKRLREDASPRHVPARIHAVDDLPRTHSGKLSEEAVSAVVNGRRAPNTEALANPKSLRIFEPFATSPD